MNETSINRQIADLLLEQTFADRMSMARWFCDAIADLNEPTIPDIANLFEGWAEAILEADDEDEDTHP